MSGTNSDYRIPKYPKLQTPVSDLGLEPKSQSKPRGTLDPISNFAEVATENLAKVAKDLPEHTKAKLLSKAIYKKDVETIVILADNGANLNPERYGYPTNLLCDCCWRGDIAVARTLLERGADPNRFGTGEGFPITSIMHAGRLSNQVRMDCATMLLDFGAHIDKDNIPARLSSALHIICVEEPDNIELVVFLLLRGADPFRQNHKGQPPAILPSHLRGITKPFKEAIKAGDRSAIDNCITVLAKFLPHDTTATLLVQWAGLAVHDMIGFAQIHNHIAGCLDKSDATLPVTATRYLSDLTKPFLAALNSGNSVAIDRCLDIVTMFLPRQSAANLLVEWAELSIHDKPVAEAIHSDIEYYLSTLDGNPPVAVARYVARYNTRHDRKDVEDAFEAARLTPMGIPISKIDGYSVDEHGILPIRLAALYALDPDADPQMSNAISILNFVSQEAAESSKAIRIKLHNAVVELLTDLRGSGVPELAERAVHIRHFLGKAPFALGGRK